MAGAGLVSNYIDLQQNELRSARIHLLASAPGSPVTGQMYYDTASNIMYYRNSSAWVPMDGSSGVTFAAPGSSAVGDTIAAGSAGSAARSDHVHGREGFAAPTATTTFGLSAVTGSAVTHVRSDHTHGTPTHTAALHQELIGLTDLTDVAITAVANGNVLVRNATEFVNIDFDTRVRTSRLDQMAVPTASVSINSQLLTNVLAPASPNDAANKAYVDAARQGLDFKDSVRVASTANVTVSGPGATIDGITMVASDRVLLKNQTAPAENGLYLWNGSAAAMTRTTDADASGEISVGSFVYIEAGTANSGQAWVASATAAVPWVPGTSSSTWTQFSGASTTTAGAGMTASGNVFNVIGTTNRINVSADAVDIDTAYVGQASITTLGTITTGTWTGTAIAVANGGTGATTAATARTNLSASGKYSQLITTSATSYVITHNLNSRDVSVTVRQANTPWASVGCIDEATTVNTVTLRFGTAPTANDLQVTVLG